MPVGRACSGTSVRQFPENGQGVVEILERLFDTRERDVTQSELFDAGATRVSIGSAMAAAAQDALVQAARELLDGGTHEFWARSLRSMGAVHAAFKAG